MNTISWIVLSLVALLFALTVADNKILDMLMDLKTGDPRIRLYRTIVSEIDKAWNALMVMLLALLSLHPFVITAIYIYVGLQ